MLQSTDLELYIDVSEHLEVKDY